MVQAAVCPVGGSWPFPASAVYILDSGHSDNSFPPAFSVPMSPTYTYMSPLQQGHPFRTMLGGHGSAV